jgi:hypothetical protein
VKPLTSHELARALLAKRDNDVRFLVIVDDDPRSVRPYFGRLIQPYDCEIAGVADQFGEETVTYDPDADAVVIRTGVLVVGDEL